MPDEKWGSTSQNVTTKKPFRSPLDLWQALGLRNRQQPQPQTYVFPKVEWGPKLPPSVPDPAKWTWESEEDKAEYQLFEKRLLAQLNMWQTYERITDKEADKLKLYVLTKLEKHYHDSGFKIPAGASGKDSKLSGILRELPYYKETMITGNGIDTRLLEDWEWNQKLGQQQVRESKIASDIKEYKQKASPYYQAKIKKFWDNEQDKPRTPEEFDKLLKDAEAAQANNIGLLKKGVNPDDLSDKWEVTQFWEHVKDEVHRIDADNKEQERLVKFKGETIVKSDWSRAMRADKEAVIGQMLMGNQVPELGGALAIYKQREQQRLNGIANLDPDRGWIKKWQLEHQPQPPALEPHLSKERILGEAERLNALAQAYPEIPEYQQAAEQAQSSLAQWEEGRVGFGMPAPPRPQELPNVPDWLASITGQTPGTMLGQGGTVTPSGQQWSRLLPSQREQYAGYLDWIKQKPEDVLARTEMMLPETPLGSRRTSWRPVGAR